jgi:DHA2 family multidrug resistance protein
MIGQRGQQLTHDGLAAAQQIVNTQAQVLSYLDIFYVFGIAALCVVPIAFFLKTPPAGAAHGH